MFGSGFTGFTGGSWLELRVSGLGVRDEDVGFRDSYLVLRLLPSEP